jgi:hypothetical protein
VKDFKAVLFEQEDIVMYIICLFFPAIIFCSVRQKVTGGKIEINIESIF